MSKLVGQDLLHTSQLSVENLTQIIETADDFSEVVSRSEPLTLMEGKILASLFYEPSTRTRLSFESAMVKLGGDVLSVADAIKTSSSAKGETLYDTGRVIESYADLVVIRHPEEGSAEELAKGASIPVINGGDGAGQHPTQALLDIYTIHLERGTLEDLTVCLVGDLKNGRTVHSLVYLLSNFNSRLVFVAPKELQMPEEIISDLNGKGIDIEEVEDIEKGLEQSDVAYVTRIQKERFEDPRKYHQLRNSYELDMDAIRRAKENITIMHPLPRVGEIAREVDDYEGAAYFRQAANGIPVRMALLALLLGKA